LVWYDFGGHDFGTHAAVDTVDAVESVDVADAADGDGHRWTSYVCVAG